MTDGETAELRWQPPEDRAHQATSYRKDASEPGDIGDYKNVLVRQTGNTLTTYIGETVEPRVNYHYAVAAYREGYPEPLSYFSNLAYATGWE